MPFTSNLYYQVYEGGKAGHAPIVLIHGVGGSHHSWPVQFRRLRGYRVISLDLPSHNKSPGCAHQRIDQYADDVYRLILEMGIYHVILIGHCMGGAIAMTLAADHPDQVTALGLTACADHFEIPADFMEMLADPGRYDNALCHFEILSFGSNTSKQYRKRIMQPLYTQRSTLLHADFLAYSQFIFSNRLTEIKCPIWIACGEEDELTPLSQVKLMTMKLKHAHLNIIKNTGHMVILEEPDLLADKLGIFLKSLR